ncbi:isopenicillin N synthase family dioxygenase [Hahella ganghwensis]|uniref:isopenicillin N synthase family dioxygenase n=1 Tax=Hahella ganghwensis TaxID=286420 RepID=UPI00035EED7A|nr:2-oxoglutarate and iron-dependent oxygenase domain-containing protein [Hahella ganghwensis]
MGLTTNLHGYLNAKEISFNEIPIIDIGPLLDGTDPEGVAERIGKICEDIGFLYIINHGIDGNLIAKVRNLTEQFFALPLEEKQRLNIVNSGPTLRGYIPMYGENVDPKHTRDFKECFDYAAHENEVSPFFGPNLMPEGLPEFKEVMEQYHQAMVTLAHHLIGAIALSLGLPNDFFYQRQRHPISIQRLLHYPPQSGDINRNEIGIGEHTDYGFLTILAQDEVGGLQVKNRNGEWVSAPPVKDSFIVNIGDLVQTFTNDRYISTLHRVINISGKERYSLPFFMDMDFDAVVEPLECCITEDNPAKYIRYTCGQHKYRRFLDSYTHLQELDSSGRKKIKASGES